MLILYYKINKQSYSIQKQKFYINSYTTTFGGNIVNYIHYNTPFRLPYNIPEYQNLMFNKNLDQHYTNFSIERDNEITD